jgi:hypothetical protein
MGFSVFGHENPDFGKKARFFGEALFNTSFYGVLLA